MSAEARNRGLWWAVIGAGVVVGGWLLLNVWWLNQPVSLPSIDEPIPILNDNREIAIGEPIRMLLRVDKPQDIEAERTSRSIICESGNLVTLTESTQDVPAGSFTAVADNVNLPNKVDVGDTCQFRYNVDYRINPIRTDEVEWLSEPFTVVER